MIYMLHQSTRRTYQIEVVQDLFDTWCVREVSSNSDNQRVNDKFYSCESKDDANRLMFDLEIKKRKYGYVYLDD